jgi:hypothetical protein
MQDTLDEIAQLQQTEQRLYQSLTKNTERKLLGSPNTFTDSEIADITSQINSLSATRVNLYNSLSETYKSQATNEHNASDILAQQTQTLQLLETELNKSKKKLSTLKDERANQLKMIEITTYYSKQYDAYRRLMRMIAIVGFCLLVAIGLKYTPLSVVSTPLAFLILVVGSFFIGGRLINMLMRRDDNYDEFVWPMAPTNTNQLNNGMGSPLGIKGVDIPFICNTSSCCGKGTVWSNSGCVVQK